MFQFLTEVSKGFVESVPGCTEGKLAAPAKMAWINHSLYFPSMLNEEVTTSSFKRKDHIYTKYTLN